MANSGSSSRTFRRGPSRSDFGSHDPDRKRKLLVHHHELVRLVDKTKTQPLTIVPLKMYFKDGRAKVEIALAKGRKQHDQAPSDRRKRDAESRDGSQYPQRREIRLTVSRRSAVESSSSHDGLVVNKGMIGFDV